MVDQVWVVPDEEIAALRGMTQEEIKARVQELAEDGEVKYGAGNGVARLMTGGLQEASANDVSEELDGDDIIISPSCVGSGVYHDHDKIGVAAC